MPTVEAMVVPPDGLQEYYKSWHDYGSSVTHAKAAELCFSQFGDPPSGLVKTRWSDSPVEFLHRVTVKRVFEVVPERGD